MHSWTKNARKRNRIYWITITEDSRVKRERGIYRFWFFLYAILTEKKNRIGRKTILKDCFHWRKYAISAPRSDQDAIKPIYSVELKGFG